MFDALKARLKEVCHRTLRRQVIAYIPYTRRLPLVEEFTPEESEDRLYDLVSEYLRRENLQALPASQRSLMTLVLRKLLASSTFAIAGALTSISRRLTKKLEDQSPIEPLEEELDQDYEALEETAEEWPEEETPKGLLSEADREAIQKEVKDLDEFAALATSIESNAKGKALLYPVQKFQSDTERVLSIILDREATKWFKPGRGQFQIFYKWGTDQREYQPDFVAETKDAIYMLEPKMRKDMEDQEVIHKKGAAISWCKRASDHASKNGGKPWKYLLIGHDLIAENITVKGLESQSLVQ